VFSGSCCTVVDAVAVMPKLTLEDFMATLDQSDFIFLSTAHAHDRLRIESLSLVLNKEAYKDSVEILDARLSMVEELLAALVCTLARMRLREKDGVSGETRERSFDYAFLYAAGKAYDSLKSSLANLGRDKEEFKAVNSAHMMSSSFPSLFRMDRPPLDESKATAFEFSVRAMVPGVPLLLSYSLVHRVIQMVLQPYQSCGYSTWNAQSATLLIQELAATFKKLENKIGTRRLTMEEHKHFSMQFTRHEELLRIWLKTASLSDGDCTARLDSTSALRAEHFVAHELARATHLAFKDYQDPQAMVNWVETMQVKLGDRDYFPTFVAPICYVPHDFCTWIQDESCHAKSY
jgi:hypothetical protein